MATVSSVEATAKTDATAAVTATESFYKTELAKAKAELAKLESETFTFKTLALVGVVALVVGGLLVHLL